eukprot:6177301-Pleurochrysis_carterae.AAC.1
MCHLLHLAAVQAQGSSSVAMTFPAVQLKLAGSTYNGLADCTFVVSFYVVQVPPLQIDTFRFTPMLTVPAF